jgi:hypothetical protein
VSLPISIATQPRSLETSAWDVQYNPKQGDFVILPMQAPGCRLRFPYYEIFLFT